MLEFGLVEALLGRRSRRFFHGCVDSGRGNGIQIAGPAESSLGTGEAPCCGRMRPQYRLAQHDLSCRAVCSAPFELRGHSRRPHISFRGRFSHQQNLFDGVYVMEVRDSSALAERREDGSLDLDLMLEALRGKVRKIREGRLGLPPEVPYAEPHNSWVVNHPGTMLVIPVGDLAQHVLLTLCYMLQNGLVVRDDINGRSIPGIEKFKGLVDTENTWPLTFVEQWSMAKLSAELSTSCYGGALMLQSMGLGGWMFNGLDPFSVLGASGNRAVPGLGFRFDTDDRWPYPNPTGLTGVMEGFCPPHFVDMGEALEALCERKFGPGGRVHNEEFRACVALQANYIFETFGKFPGTVPSIFVLMYLQAHHLDLEFYDRFFKEGAYLKTHAAHRARWHPEDSD